MREVFYVIYVVMKVDKFLFFKVKTITIMASKRHILIILQNETSPRFSIHHLKNQRPVVILG